MPNLTTPLRYDSDADVSMRLDQTFVRYKNKVYWCRAYSDLTVRLYKTHNDNEGLIVHSSDEDLDLSSIRVGFIPKQGNYYPYYVSRAPLRKYKQGICSSNLVSSTIRNGKITDLGGIRGLNFDTNFYNMLNGKYPKWDKAFTTLEGSNTEEDWSCPIDYDFCLYRKGTSSEVILLDSSFDTVGVVNKQTKKLTVNGWWSTPTMVDLLQSLGVTLNE